MPQAMLMFALIDAVDPRYGGSPDPDDERRRRWSPIDKRVSLPFLGSATCLIASAVTAPPAGVGLTVAAVGLCYMGARAALEGRVAREDADDSADFGDDLE